MAKPKIRFKGFSEDWEQRKLGKVADIVTGKLDANAMNETGEYDFYTSGIQKYKIDVPAFEGPAITIAGNGATVGYMHLANGKFNAYQRTYVLSAFQANREFLFYEIGNKLPKKISQEARTGNIPYIVMDMLTDLQLSIPCEQEQRKLGEFMMSLDHLITLHQRKCDEIKTLKKYMLQKMFPEKGKRVPEIRFDGFTEDWEQRKLGELYTERNERGNDSLQILSVSIHSGVSDGELNEESLGKIVRRSKDKAKYKRVYSGDLIFNMMRAWQGAIGVAKTEGMVSPAYISAIPNEVIYPEFMNYLLRRKVIIGQINNLSYGVTDFRKRLYWNSFSKVMCQVPSTEEQKNIGEFFSKLDHLITLHQHKCEELQKLKKFMLQNMFV